MLGGRDRGNKRVGFPSSTASSASENEIKKEGFCSLPSFAKQSWIGNGFTVYQFFFLEKGSNAVNYLVRIWFYRL